ncbi:V-type proton ATPase subunit G [Lachnellula hyalina]|uniref:V-type proton ATPase subunit G n=1 Tax=Lachnellula hyalina TaxID=1316788 RepID=A0A8H8U2Y0_9HELO|nr:V-type proton ATPase subunit G [Lachnellula hyalina]TVY29741.1 V-type proton ATPase subunit G [Lachnellula hyalina]
MSAQNSAGIQTLLDAEREAQKIVQRGWCSGARVSIEQVANVYHVQLENLMIADRTKRVKEARDEAKKEIDEYKKQKDVEFKKFESEHTSGNKKAEEDASKDAEVKIKEIQEAGKKGQDQVVKDLLKAVIDVKPVVPDRIEVPK